MQKKNRIIEDVYVRQDLRPCLVNGVKALFHQWYTDQFVREAILIGRTSGQVSNLYGIVEFEDGSVHYADPKSIKFQDNKLKYCFMYQTTDLQNKEGETNE